MHIYIYMCRYVYMYVYIAYYVMYIYICTYVLYIYQRKMDFDKLLKNAMS